MEIIIPPQITYLQSIHRDVNAILEERGVKERSSNLLMSMGGFGLAQEIQECHLPMNHLLILFGVTQDSKLLILMGVQFFRLREGSRVGLGG